jgi:hypothetical protein
MATTHVRICNETFGPAGDMYGRWDNQMLRRYSAKGLAFCTEIQRQFPTQGADRQEWQFKLEH